MLNLLFVLFAVGVTAPPAEKVDSAIARAADVICGETGSDEVMATHVAYVIWNRMNLLPGARADKILHVLNEHSAFAGSCKKHGRTPTDWVLLLARTLADGDPNKLVVRSWMTDRVLRFTDRKEPCRKHHGKRKKSVCRNTVDRWVLQGHKLVGRIGNMNFYEE